MHLSYVQHNGCPTRLLLITPIDPHLICPDCDVVFYPQLASESPLPCPFITQSSAKCAVVIKPTNGFFKSFKIGDDLHIGITDSNSTVHSFWTNGICAETSHWEQSILVVQFTNEATTFDESLNLFIQQMAFKFLPQYYNDIEWNCFDFVMEFLKFMNFRQYSKVQFVAEFVQEALKLAMRYCTLLRKVEEKGYMMIA